MNLKTIPFWLSSMKLTIACLFGAMLLVFFGTLEEVSSGIFFVQQKYFRSFFLYWEPKGFPFKIPYFPGGYFIGGLLLLNLTAACGYRFRFHRRSFGILLLHLGLALLILGELIYGMFSVESQMAIRINQTSNYSESIRDMELVIIDRSNAGYDQVVSIPEKLLRPGKTIKPSALPFALTIRALYPNQIVYAELADENSSLGTWKISSPQKLAYEGKEYELAIRRQRHYYPFSIQLTDFTRELYPGTQIPKSFTSSVKLFRKDGELDRQTLIYMNHPLRYEGKAFYQASYADNDTVSVFQVVDNPGWLIPYLSCSLVSVGLLFQFLASFYRFNTKKRS